MHLFIAIREIGLHDYEDTNNRNRVVYHDQSTPQNEKIQKVINDAVALLPKCKDEYGQTDDYQLLQRAIDEQTQNDDKGNRIPKTKEDGMTPDMLQNPSDPEATYRSKAGKSHKGYSANLVEAVDEKGSVIVDYQTVPSILRNKYTVDKMPVRRKLKTKQFFGFKVVALNFSKLMRFTQGKLKCRSFEFT